MADVKIEKDEKGFPIGIALDDKTVLVKGVFSVDTRNMPDYYFRPKQRNIILRLWDRIRHK